MRLSKLAAAVVAVLLATLSTAGAEELIVPTGMNLDTTDGNTSSPFPFATWNEPPVSSNFPFRYQQVYGASYFTSYADLLRITELRFRVDQGMGDRAAYSVPPIQVYLSTTAAQPDALAGGSTAAMDGNIGTDERLVFSGPRDWNACGTGGCPPNVLPFDQVIPLATPFVYDPTAGNLLLEVQYPEGGPYPEQRYDAVGTGDLMSNVREVVLRSDGVTHSFQPPDSFGLVTQFVFTLPEPGAGAIAFAAFAALVALRRIRA